MRCYICNKPLSDKEVVYNEDLKQDEPCTTCLDIAMDAAYSGDFSWFDDDNLFVVPEEFDEDVDPVFYISSYNLKGDDT